VEFRQFEREFLRLAFTSSIDLTPSSLAFVIGIAVREAEKHMQALVSQGVLELTSDDDGRLTYSMPDRPAAPMALDDPALSGPRLTASGPPLYGAGISADVAAGLRPRHALALRGGAPVAWEPRRVGSGQAVASMFLNAMVCPGVGSLVGGKTGTGLAQLSLFLIGLPLAVVAVGLPLVVGAWVWGIATGAQLIAEARDY
jgi:TM2 domain-containing membrane protein YozV